MKKKRIGWITPQIEALSLGIRACFPYQIMATAMGRTVESVRKASERHLGHLTDTRKRGPKPKFAPDTAASDDHFLITVDRWCRAHNYRLESILCQRARNRLKQIPAATTLNALDTDNEGIPKSFSKRRRRYVPPKILTMGDLCHLLKQEGHTVRETDPVITGKRDREKLYIMNGALVSAGEMLLSVNRRRTARGLHPLYIDDVTEF